jgi:hypothetical protein
MSWTTPLRCTPWLIVLMATGSPSAGSATAPENPRPQVQLSHTEIDAGELLKGTAGRFEFTVRNTGEMPLEIAVKPTCGCTVAECDRLIAPGSEGKITAVLDTAGMSGRVRKLLNVTTNDPTKSTVPLTLAVTVVEPVDVDRASLRLLQLSEDAPTTLEFPVRVDPSEPTQITGVTCEQPHAHAVLQAVSSKPTEPRRYQVRVTVDADAPLGRTTVAVALQTDSPRQPTVPVTITCEKGIVVGAREIYFGILRESTPTPVVRNVLIHRKGSPFQITNVASSDPRVEIQAVPQNESSYRLVTRYRGGAPEGLSKGTLRIETDDPRQPLFEIPVSYRIAAAGPQKLTPGAAPSP